VTDVRVLGPVVVSTEAGPARLRPREAAVVAALALADRPLATAEIVDVIWSVPPASAANAVRNHVSHLRQSVGGLVSVGSGYRFETDVRVDARVVEDLALRARGGELEGSAADQAATLLEARSAWRGDAFGELVAHPRVVAAREHLEHLRLVVDEELAAALLDAGRTDEARLLLERLVADAPRRSRRWSLLALASYRMGMRDAALAASMRANDFRTDAGLADDGQIVLMLRDDPVLMTSPARPVTRRVSPIIGKPIDPRPRRHALVGRDPQLQALTAAIDRVAGDDRPETNVVVLEGEPGIGKTTLAYRAATNASGRGFVALWAWCDLAPVGLFPVLSRLVQDLVAAIGGEAVAELAGDDLPALIELAPDAAWSAGSPTASGRVGRGSADAAIRLLDAAARRRPILCVVDDVQWALPSTIRVITELAACDGALVLLVVTRRGQLPPGLEFRPSATIELDELDVDAVSEFLRGSLEFEPDAALVDLIWSRAGGHPLLLREIVDSIEPAATPEAVRRLAAGPECPRSVADAVARRLRELSPAALRAVEAASVLGASFSPPQLADMVDLADDALAEAAAAGIVAPEARRGRARFCHELVRVAIYDGLPEVTRARLHEAAGTALTNRKVPRWSEIAHHFAASADLDPRRAVSACRRAGQEALASFQYDDAAEHHRREVELLERIGETDTPALVDALVDRGAAMLRSGDPAVVDVLMRAALTSRDLGDHERLARSMILLCDVGPASEVGVPTPELSALLDLALERVEDPDTSARLLASASYHHSMSGDWAYCRSLYDRAVAVDAGSRTMAEILPFAAVVLGGPDDLGRRWAAADQLEVIAHQDRDPLAQVEALYVRAGVQVQLADPQFRSTLDEMIRLEPSTSAPGLRWAISYLSAARAHIDGDLVTAERAAVECLGPRCRGVAESRRIAGYGAQLVALRAEEGRLGELVPRLEELVVAQPAVAGWRAVLVAALVPTDPDRARREFDRLATDGFAALARDFSWTAAMVTLTSGIAAAGDADRARLVYDLLAPYSGRMSWSGNCTFGPIDQALGEAATAFGSHEAADAHFRRAAELAGRIDAPRMLLRARAGSRPRLPGPGGDGIVN
jgi:DNA-binding SARP family transcriptional activator